MVRPSTDGQPRSTPMKPIIFAGALALTFAMAASMPLLAATPAPAATPSSTASAAPKLHAASPGLWQGHIQHTRAYAMAVKSGDSAAAKKAADDVVANAKQISDAVAGFYG